MDFILFIAALALAFWVLRWVIGQLAVPTLIVVVLLPFYLLWYYHPVLFWIFMVITIAAASFGAWKWHAGRDERREQKIRVAETLKQRNAEYAEKLNFERIRRGDPTWTPPRRAY